jgi:hypothetical protein
VTYLRLLTTRLLPSGKERAICEADATRTRLQTSSFIGCCLYLASKTLVLYSLQRQTPCVPRSNAARVSPEVTSGACPACKCVSNCLHPEGFPVLRLFVLFYQGSCTFARFLIRLPAALLHNLRQFCPNAFGHLSGRSSFTLGGIVNSLIIHPDTHPVVRVRGFCYSS